MARLHEYQGKAILAANGFKIPRGRAASTTDEAIAAAKELADGNKAADQAEKDKELTEDENKKVQEDIQHLTKKYEGTVADMAAAREAEVMGE